MIPLVQYVENLIIAAALHGIILIKPLAARKKKVKLLLCNDVVLTLPETTAYLLR